MPIMVNLDVMMAKRKISAGELAERVGITQANLSILNLPRTGLSAGGRLGICQKRIIRHSNLPNGRRTVLQISLHKGKAKRRRALPAGRRKL